MSSKFFSFLILFSICFVGVTFAQATDDCGIKFGCFLVPTGCQNASCNFVVKWTKANNNSIQFILSTKVDYQWWMAIGFSYDQIMGNDSVAMCKLDKMTNKSTVETYYNNYHSPPDILNSTNRSLGLSEISVSFINGLLSCSFQRQIRNDSFGEKFYDLNQMYYLLVAKSVLKDNDEPSYHYDNKTYSAEKIDFRFISNATADPEVLIKWHGTIMMFTWMILSTIGIILARYLKNIFPNEKSCGLEIWFALHRPLMVSCSILSLAGFYCIFYHKKWTWVDVELNKQFIHSIFGVLTITLAIIQPVLAVFRPNKDAKNRHLFNHLHRIMGLSTFLSSHIAIFLGVYMYFGRSIGWQILVFWFTWLVFLVSAMEINTRCTKDQPKAYKQVQYEKEHSQHTKKTKVNSIMFMIHIFVSILIFFALYLYLTDGGISI